MEKKNWTFRATSNSFVQVGDKFQTEYKVWEEGELTSDERTYFGFVYEGELSIEINEIIYLVKPNMFFVLPPKGTISGKGKALLSSIHSDFKGIFLIGGVIEEKGRLKYIDGCSDTVLINPIVSGDPCLNFLYIPTNTSQTDHTHPSVRIGIVVSGNGICKTSYSSEVLSKGKLFVLPPDAIHSFHTLDDELRIVVFHPDSDTGPSHDDHPMLNRSFVDNKSAKDLNEIRTKNL